MFDLNISNTAVYTLNYEVRGDTINENTCACDTCYTESDSISHCLSTCDLGQYSETEGGSCLSCNNCPNGCIAGTHCVPNLDPLCAQNQITGFEIADCGGCTIGAFRDEDINDDLCECTPNSTFDVALHECACNSGYRRRTDQTCELCKNYLKAGEFVQTVTFSESYLDLTLQFTSQINLTGISNCNFMIQPTLSKLGANPQCEFKDGAREARVILGSGATIDANDEFHLDSYNLETVGGTCDSDRIDIVGTVSYNAVTPSPTAIFSVPAEISLGCNQSLVVDATNSQGSLGRTLSPYEWTFVFSSESGGITSTTNISSTTAEYSIPSSDLSAGYVQATLRLTNFIGQSDTYTSSFRTYINPDPTLSVSFDVPSVHNVHRDDLVQIKASADNVCPDATTSTYTYIWELDQLTGTSTTPNVTFDNRRLRIA